MTNDRAGKVLCLCSRCRVSNYLDDRGQQSPGKWVSPRTKSSHETSDQVKELKEAEEARERVENAILLGALSSRPASDPHSFAVRPRDLDTIRVSRKSLHTTFETDVDNARIPLSRSLPKPLSRSRPNLELQRFVVDDLF